MNISQSNPPAPSPPKGEHNLEAKHFGTININDNFGAAIVELWKKYAHLNLLNMPGCEYRKSALAMGIGLEFGLRETISMHI